MSDSLDWRPGASLQNLQKRALLLSRIRDFFAERGVMEVETPILAAGGSTDPHLDSFKTHYHGPGEAQALYLQTSPEFAMKRLLAAGSGPIYQITKAFRNGEAGRLHNPEFTMLEWYRPGLGYFDLMDEVEALIRDLMPLTAERLAYEQVFRRYAGVDPHTASLEELQSCVRNHSLVLSPGVESMTDRDAWLDLLMTHVVEPQLARHHPLVFVYDYPSSRAMLACVRPGHPPVAERFELYLHGIELANGFHELTDVEQQAARFEADRRSRLALGLEDVPQDDYLIAALRHGLSDCSGVALGLDRLIMVALGAVSISDVMAFSFERA